MRTISAAVNREIQAIESQNLECARITGTKKTRTGWELWAALGALGIIIAAACILSACGLTNNCNF